MVTSGLQNFVGRLTFVNLLENHEQLTSDPNQILFRSYNRSVKHRVPTRDEYLLVY